MTKRKSEAQAKKELSRLLEQIESSRTAARRDGREFVSSTEEQLLRRIRGDAGNSPFFTWASFDGVQSPGGVISYMANYYNPDPVGHLAAVSIIFGLGILDAAIPGAIALRDARWPYVSTHPITVLEPGANGVAQLSFPAPFAAKGVYIGNVVLWGGSNFLFHESAKIFDRTMFWVSLK